MSNEQRLIKIEQLVARRLEHAALSPKDKERLDIIEHFKNDPDFLITMQKALEATEAQLAAEGKEATLDNLANHPYLESELERILTKD